MDGSRIDVISRHCYSSCMQLTIKTPADFNFQRTVLSHGWCELLPFEIDRAKWKLTRVLDIDRAKPVTVEVSPRKGGMKIEVSRRLGRRAAQKSSAMYDTCFAWTMICKTSMT